MPAPAPAAPSELDATIVVPVVDGDAEVDQVVHALGRELDLLGRSWECVLVFDGVRGAAWEKVSALETEFGARLKTIAFQKPFGESVCLSAGAERARGRIIVTSPQYVQCDPAELGAMLGAIDAGADLVTPWRRPRVDPWLNRIQSASFNWVIRRLVRGEFHDLNCYFRAFRRAVLEDVAIYGDLYRFLPVIAQRQGFRVVEVPVRHLKEWGEAGFFGVGVYVRRALDVLAVMFLTKFTLKPLRFFGSIGLVLLLPSGFALAVMVVQRLLGITSLHNRPAFILALMLFVLGVQVIGFGLVGEIIIYTQARNLREYRIDRVYDDDVHDSSRRDRGAGDS
jgi:glycosyltransferase involved in cell wall biosynthesis